MKKNSYLGFAAFLAVTVIILLACQKDQAKNTASVAAGDESTIMNTASTATIPGLISGANANELRTVYINVAGPNATQYVAFSLKDITNFLNSMKSKYKSDSVYVNFGVYDYNTDPTADKSEIGKTTIFFTVNNNLPSKGNFIKTNSNDGGDTSYNSLNHGNIWP